MEVGLLALAAECFAEVAATLKVISHNSCRVPAPMGVHLEEAPGLTEP